MSITRKLVGVGADEGAYVDDVFSTYLYEGDQSNTNRDIVNGIDLDDKGGLVWIKVRSQNRPHYLFDTERGTGRSLETNSTGGQSSQATGTLRSFNTDGFSLGDSYTINETGEDCASWTWAKQEGFFDVVTWAGDSRTREIPHNLGSEPGMFIIKCTNANNSDWQVWHREANGGEARLVLNSTAAENTNSIPLWWGDSQNYIAPTDTHITIGGQGAINMTGREYVAYIFAHDAPMFGPNGDESIIKCGSYTGNGSDDGPEIDLGWEPQWLLVKNTSNAPGSWFITDNMRGMGASNTIEPYLAAESSRAEIDVNEFYVTSDGFKISSSSVSYNNSGDTYIYMAIRRPMKPAEEFEPDELFATANFAAGSAPHAVAGFPVDMQWFTPGGLFSEPRYLSARLIQGSRLQTNSTSAAASSSTSYFDYQDGWLGWTESQYQSWMFRRAPGFFDVVTYEGDGQNSQVVPHNLSAVPEMLWVKRRNAVGVWSVVCTAVSDTQTLGQLEVPYEFGANTLYPVDQLTAESFTVDVNYSPWNGASDSLVAMMWASVPGICDIGSYTGTGADMNIDCGFTNGARFILIKRSDYSGDWYYWDTLRGITAGNDPYFLLNNEDTETTNTDYIDPLASGFTVTSSAPSALNASGGEYIYMAIA